MRPGQDSSSSSSSSSSFPAVPLKTKRGANFHFHFYTSILFTLLSPGPTWNLVQYLVNTVSHSLSRSCRAVPCVVFVTLTWTFQPDLLDKQGASHPTSLSFPAPPPCRRPGPQPSPLLLLSRKASQPASRICSSDLVLLLLPTARLNLPGLPAPSPYFGTWELVCT